MDITAKVTSLSDVKGKWAPLLHLPYSDFCPCTESHPVDVPPDKLIQPCVTHTPVHCPMTVCLEINLNLIYLQGLAWT